MAVPTSGTSNLSMRGIKDELENNNYAGSAAFTNISLSDMSDGTDATINTANAEANRPDAQAPHTMSEWYDYDHDLVGIGTPSNFTYASTTQAITFTYDEASSTDRTYVELRNLNGSTTFQNQPISDTGDMSGTAPNMYQEVDGSGQSSFTLGDGDDTYPGVKGSPTQISTDLNQNDYLTIRARGFDEGTPAYGSYTGDITGWTLPDSPTSFAVSHARTGGDDDWGDGDDGAYTETLTWSAQTGGASSYKVTHGPNSSRTNGSNTQDVAVSSGTSLAVTGINNVAQRYAWVAAVGGGGDTGAYTALGAHSVNEEYYTSIFAGFTIAGAASTLAGPFSNIINVVSDVKTFQIVYNTDTEIRCTLTGNSGLGILYVSMGTGDPGTGGSDNSATGFVQEGTNCNLTGISTTSDIIYVRFKYRTHNVAGVYPRTARFEILGNGAEFSRTITARTTA